MMCVYVSVDATGEKPCLDLKALDDGRAVALGRARNIIVYLYSNVTLYDNSI